MKTMTQLELDIAAVWEMLKKLDKYFEDGTWVSGHGADCPMCVSAVGDCDNSCVLVTTISHDDCHHYIPQGTRANCFQAKDYTRKAKDRWVLKAKVEFEYALVCLWDEYKEGE